MKRLLITMLLMGGISQAQAGNTFYQCMQSLQHVPSLQIIRDKVSLSGGSENLFNQLSDNSYPTPEERNAIGIWGGMRQNCANASGISDPGINQAQAIIAGLYQGRMTYAEYTKQAQDLLRRITESRQTYRPSPPPPSSDPLYNPYVPAKPVTTRCRWDVLMQETVCETR